MSRYFGTDGIRGIANKELTPELSYRTARALAVVLKDEPSKEILIGKDTRKSGAMLEAAISSGLMSVGFSVKHLGVIPTPGVAYLTKKTKSAAGIVISASHNPGEYNGIKIFNRNGFKLTDEEEIKIESLIERGVPDRPAGYDIGTDFDYEQGIFEYGEFLKEFAENSLSGMRVAIDAGCGALGMLAPYVLRSLGAEVYSVNTVSDGMDINFGTGSTNPSIISELTKQKKADIGLSFDGDGDRVIAVDENGDIIDGDRILAICAISLLEEGKLKKNTLVGTVMTNLGLELYLRERGVKVSRTKVGDRYILEEMLYHGYNFGGEPSGHIIFLDANTTGDGLQTGLFLLKVMKEKKLPLSQLGFSFSKVPQVLVNAKVRNERKTSYLEVEEIRNAIEEIEKRFDGRGRVVIRPSGTEPLVRVMIEADTGEDLQGIAEKLAKLMEEKIG